MNQSHSPEWQAVLDEVKKGIRKHQFDTWFATLSQVSFSDDSVEIKVPNQFFKEWLESRYMDILKRAVHNAAGRPLEVQLEIDANDENTSATESQTAARADVESPPIGQSRRDVTDRPQLQLNSRYTFDNFVVGPCNRLCHAAALAVAESPGQAYNPLFLHGSVGLGKTHLLQATCHALLKKADLLKVRYLSCETFMNEFISAIQNGGLEDFRARYRYIDVLLIDDIHFMEDAERTKEEFFHTFNALYNAQKQIILSSDSPPEEIPVLEERLVSRFKWGLVARINPPAYETRMAVIRAKAELRGITLPEDVAQFLANHITNNIRELEGAIIKLIGYSSLTNREIDLELAKETLEATGETKKNIKIEDILGAVSRKFGVKVTDLQSKKKSKSIAFPRQIFMHLARTLTNRSLEEIGGFCGGRDHTTVMYADEKIRAKGESDPGLRATLESITRELTR